MNNKKNIKNSKKNILKNKKDCCMQSLKEVNCFLYKFTKTKRIYNFIKLFR